ncbi:MAG: translocation/assembly module TamB domain-containing protein [Mangrovibacterium sp.]
MGGVFLALLFTLYVLLHFSGIQTWLVRQFTEKLSLRLNTEVSIDKVKFSFFDKLHLEHVRINDLNNDTLFYIDELVATINEVNFLQKEINLESVSLSDCDINTQLDRNRQANFAFIIDTFRKKDAPHPLLWRINCQNFELNNVVIDHRDENEKSQREVKLKDIRFEAHHFSLSPDSIYFEINDLNVYQSEQFAIENMSARFTSKGKLLQVSDLNITMPNSHIKDFNLSIDQSRLVAGEKITQSDIKLSLGTTEISMSDLGYFIPVIKHPKGTVRLCGELSGRLDSIQGKKITIQRGDHTAIHCNLSIVGLPNFQDSKYHIVLQNSSLEFSDLDGLMKSDLINKKDFLSETLKGVGIIKYDGSFIGSPNDFVAKGTFETNYGIIKGDLAFSPTPNKGTKAKGNISTHNFQLGELLRNDQLGLANFKGKVNALIDKNDQFVQARVEGKIDSLDFNNYSYQNIHLNGLIKPNLFEGDFNINDQHLKLNFNGLANANPKNPAFAFKLQLDQADLKKLNFMGKYNEAKIALNIDANFSGEDYAHLFGEITLPSGYFITEYDSLQLDTVLIRSAINDIKELRITSEYVDYQMNGIFNYSDLGRTFQSILHQYLPAAVPHRKENDTNSNFDFEMRIKNLQPILHTFFPTLAIDSGYVMGTVDEPRKAIRIDSKIGKVMTPKMSIRQSSLHIDTDNEIQIGLTAHEIFLGSMEAPFQFKFQSHIAQNNMTNRWDWSSAIDTENQGELINEIKFESDSSFVLFNHRSNFRLNNTVWQVSPSSIVFHHAKALTINNFMINNSFQSLYLNGLASEHSSDFIQLKLTNIDLKNLNPFSPQKNHFQGTMNGELNLYSLFSNMHFVGNFNINELIYNQENLGNIALKSNWDKEQESVNAELNIEQPQGNLHAKGYFHPTTDSLNLAVNAQKISLNFLSPLLSKLFKNIHGYATGGIVFHGEKSNLLIDGDLFAEDAQIALNALNANYHFNDTVKFRQDSIIFDQIRIYDDENHTGRLNGSLKHTNFNHMVYNLSLNSRDLLIMNTSTSDNEQFFGKAYGRGRVDITGKGNEVNITGTATTLSNTNISFAPMSDEKAESYNFLSFVKHNSANQSLSLNNLILPTAESTKLNMKFNITITPDAKFQLVFNSQIGDVIQAKGKGNMQVNIDENFNIGMFGEFEATWGDYLFTLQNIFSKRFSIESGSTIQWSGNPYSADLNIKAIYNLKAPLNDLIVDNYSGYDFSQRVPVDCYIILKDELSNPNISFDIKFPTVEDRIQDELKQYMSTEEDMNRQMLSLLLMGNFYTPEYLQGSYSGLGTTFMGTTTSELLSNQLSNWLSAISDNFDLGVNYRPGNDITNDEVELALSTQLFNNRVTINGNISNNVNTTGSTNTNNSSALVGDFDVLVALSKNGKLQLKAYNHSNNNIIYETSPYKQGVGFSYQEDFNTWKDCWQKIKNIFRPNRRPTERNKNAKIQAVTNGKRNHSKE